MSGTVHSLELKRGATWALGVELTQDGADWSDASYLIHLRQNKDDAEPLAVIVPTAVIGEDTGVVSVQGVVAAEVTSAFPLGRIYADLRVIRPDSFGTQYPAEWVIDNVIVVTR